MVYSTGGGEQQGDLLMRMWTQRRKLAIAIAVTDIYVLDFVINVGMSCHALWTGESLCGMLMAW